MDIRNHGCKYQSVIADVMDDPASGLDDLIKVHRAIFNLETIEDRKIRLVFFWFHDSNEFWDYYVMIT